ncbi:MAG TPA: protein-L-isoaspartate(D-aspartate) O-methyltransferase [Bacteroidales bacterium]|nr:protein-L-isoaspartate(D-aspartate) O-methyltransferase [Bacteroidales bacterium]
MEDTFRHKGLRNKLVECLRLKGIRDEKVLLAINKVPRHLFLESSLINHAYQDKALPIGAGQTISQPYTVAVQSELLKVKPFEKVLEIGTGSGYQACVLLEMSARVYTIERQRELYLKAMSFLPQIGYNPQFFYGDGYLGLPTYGPFDKIIITAGAPEVPKALLEQLKIGGRLVAPIGDSQVQVMTVVERKGEDSFVTTHHGSFIFVPLLKGTE